MKGIAKRLLSSAGLLPAARRARRWLTMTRRVQAASLRSAVRAEPSPDGLPLPPARLRFLVVGSTDVSSFVEGGQRVAGTIERTLARNGLDMRGFEALLDFGVGCGRVARHWSKLNGVEVHGSDYNAELVEWCKRNLRFGVFTTNELAPPLAYADAKFDFAYAYSVFTHLPEEIQRAWISELARVLKPGGHLLVTTHGERFAEARLDAENLDRFRNGELVLRPHGDPGSNIFAAFHPPEYVREELARGLEVVDFIPGAGPKARDPGRVPQDVYLLRKAEAAT